jgi:hypothetical protein
MSKCVCGHEEAEHDNDDGGCMSKVRVGNNWDFCECMKYDDE